MIDPLVSARLRTAIEPGNETDETDLDAIVPGYLEGLPGCQTFNHPCARSARSTLPKLHELARTHGPEPDQTPRLLTRAARHLAHHALRRETSLTKSKLRRGRGPHERVTRRDGAATIQK